MLQCNGRWEGDRPCYCCGGVPAVAAVRVCQLEELTEMTSHSAYRGVRQTVLFLKVLHVGDMQPL